MIHALNLRSTVIFAASCLFSATAALAQGTGAGGDLGAAWAPMFNSSGAIAPTGFVELNGGSPPLLGTTTSVQLSAPGFNFGIFAVSLSAHAGSPVNVGGDVLDIYIDPFVSLGSFALPMLGGQAQLNLPLPPDPALSGLDLAFQGLLLDPIGNVAASNLLAGQVGLIFGAPVHFAFQFGPLAISRHRYWPTTATKQPIANNTSGAAKNYTISGVKNQGGTLEVRDETGAVLHTFGPNDIALNVTLNVANGSQLYWYNSSGSTINGVTWQVDCN